MSFRNSYVTRKSCQLSLVLLALTLACAGQPIKTEQGELNAVVRYYSDSELADARSDGVCMLSLPYGIDLRRHARAGGRPLKAQGTVDALGRKQGRWIEWHIDQDLYQCGAYIDDVRVGQWEIWRAGYQGVPEALILRWQY